MNYSSVTRSFAKSYLIWTGWVELKSCTLASQKKPSTNTWPSLSTMASKLQSSNRLRHPGCLRSVRSETRLIRRYLIPSWQKLANVAPALFATWWLRGLTRPASRHISPSMFCRLRSTVVSSVWPSLTSRPWKFSLASSQMTTTCRPCAPWFARLDQLR